MSTEEYDAITAFVNRPEVAELFADAVAQGLHAPFALDADYWGRQYQAKLLDLLDAVTAELKAP